MSAVPLTDEVAPRRAAPDPHLRETAAHLETYCHAATRSVLQG